MQQKYKVLQDLCPRVLKGSLNLLLSQIDPGLGSSPNKSNNLSLSNDPGHSSPNLNKDQGLRNSQTLRLMCDLGRKHQKLHHLQHLGIFPNFQGHLHQLESHQHPPQISYPKINFLLETMYPCLENPHHNPLKDPRHPNNKLDPNSNNKQDPNNNKVDPHLSLNNPLHLNLQQFLGLRMGNS
jgi:hypothetical protein